MLSQRYHQNFTPTASRGPDNAASDYAARDQSIHCGLPIMPQSLEWVPGDGQKWNRSRHCFPQLPALAAVWFFDMIDNQPMYEKLFDLTGRVALVTGGSRGLGKAMARAFAEQGANIMICSRNAEELKQAAGEIGAGLSVRVEWMTADLADRNEPARLAAETLARLGRVDVLVNNAGSNIPQRVDEITDDAWDRIIELNLSGIMRLTRSLLPQMMERRWGRVIHISSVLGLGGKKGRNVYSATKAALVGMARSSALDLGPFGVTVNCIAPGPFLTELPLSVLTEDQKKEFTERTALKRWGNPEEIAGTALLLGTDAGSYITGTTILIDGGTLANIL